MWQREFPVAVASSDIETTAYPEYLQAEYLTTIDQDDRYLYAKCNNAPILLRTHLMKTAPVRSELQPEAKFQLFGNITGYRFTNPAGVTYDSIAAHEEGILETITMVPDVPIQEHSWFPSYSWRVMYVTGCDEVSGHIGWAFYCTDKSCLHDQEAIQVSRPDFIFFVVWSSTSTEEGGSGRAGQKETRLMAGSRGRRNMTTSINHRQ